MKFKIKGNYFQNEYHLPPLSGPDSTGQVIKKLCPADLECLLWEFPLDYRHVEPVVSSAIEGFKTWRNFPTDQRINCLRRYQEQLIARTNDIAEAISWETGKPLWEAKTEVNSTIQKVTVTIENSLPRIEARHFPEIMTGTQGHVYFKPIGPSLVIGPFNFPCHLANGQILSALIAGNSVIFKPSEKTMYSAQLLIDCFHSAGFPKGTVNLIQGDGEIARRILKEKSIKGVFFTGSKEVGKKIIESTHNDLTKLVALELGGKNTSILHKDCDIKHALTELVKACYLTSGQRCVSTSIIAVHNDVKDEFITKFHDLAKRIIVDHPISYEKEPFMGPLIDQQAMDNYLLFMGMAKREGIEEIMRGKQINKRFKGYYVSPSIHLCDKFKSSSHFLSSEIFGPNCTFIPYNDIEEAITIANKTEYGLAASLFTSNKNNYELCLKEIDVGILNLNRSTVGASAKLPFGGIKNSGNHRPAALTTIDACVYPMSSLEANTIQDEGINSIPGINTEN